MVLTTVIITGILLFLAGYGYFILTFTLGLYKLDKQCRSGSYSGNHDLNGFNARVTVIIPTRNEIRNITRILDEIRNQDYPVHLLDVIVSDDFSTDHTCAFVERFMHHYPGFPLVLVNPKDKGHLGGEGKKRAIERAIRVSKGELVLATDADTHRGSRWVSAMVSAFSDRRVKMVLGPVVFQNEKNVLQKIQSLEFAGLMGVTAGAAYLGRPVMCNGANLAYTVESFQATGGFRENHQFASGDDQFLMAGIKEMQGGRAIVFQYDRLAVVWTEAEKSFSGFINQRLRWASKGSGYRDPYMITVALVTYLVHFFLLTGMLASFWWPRLFFITFFLWIVKILLDYPLVLMMTRFFGKQGLLGYYFISQVFQLVYVVAIGLSGLVVPFYWKGRKKVR